jgi:hypothetical protein
LMGKKAVVDLPQSLSSFDLICFNRNTNGQARQAKLFAQHLGQSAREHGRGGTERHNDCCVYRRDRFGVRPFSCHGLIEVISPPISYYPNMDKLRVTLNDPIERVKWRSKQNLDFAFLMAYSQIKATFYVQLEDDILAKRGFITIMKQFAVAKTAKQEQDPWFVLDFCQLGFIGK